MLKYENTLLLALMAVVVLACGQAALADPFADHVVYNWDGATATYAPGPADNTTYGPFHSSGFWNNPQAVLGKPNVVDKDDTDWNPGTSEFREINVVWPAWYQGVDDPAAANTNYASNPTGATKVNNGCGLRSGSQIVVEFDEIITNDANNPYGLDFIVHGNPFFATGEMVYKDTNMNEYTLGSFSGMGAGAVFEERVTVSVAQSLDGPWYTYDSAFGDWFFPTQPLKWDREATNPNTGEDGDWTSEEMDWTKPVNPTLTDLENEAQAVGTGTYNYFGGATVADALDLYDGSAGGTGFDLAESPFEWIKYVQFTDPDGKEGEICGVVDVAPAIVADSLSVTWHNVENGTSSLRFQAQGDESTTIGMVNITSIDEDVVADVTFLELADLGEYTPISEETFGAYLVELSALLDGTEVGFEADLSLWVDDAYLGDGSDLIVLHWNGSSWDELVPSAFDPASRLLRVDGLMEFSPFVVAQVPEPAMMSLLVAGGLALIRRRRK
jgi:hypothetical protein